MKPLKLDLLRWARVVALNALLFIAAAVLLWVAVVELAEGAPSPDRPPHRTPVVRKAAS